MSHNKWGRQDSSIKKLQKTQEAWLNNQIQQFSKLLKNMRIHHLGNKKNLFQSNWNLIVGQNQSGKTSLLYNSEIDFVFHKKQPNKLNREQETVWWATPNAVALDTPGDYFNLQQKNTGVAYRAFLKAIKKNSYLHQLSNLILVIDYSQLKHSNETEQRILFDNICQHIKLVKHVFPSLNHVFLILNKIDHLDGFHDFFDHLSTEQRQQYFGLLFKPHSGEELSQQFNSEFDGLVARLKNQMLHLIHQENNYQTKFYIHQFSTKFNLLKESINQLLRHLTHQEVDIDGLFFTSAAQTKPEKSSTDATEIFSKETLPILSTITTDKGYFIHDLFSKLIFTTKPTVTKNKWTNIANKWLLILGTTIAFIFLSFVFIAGTNYFLKRTEQLSQYSNAFNLYQSLPTQKTDIKNDLSSLVYLRNILTELEQSNLYSIKNKTQQTYQKAQETLLMPLVVNSIEKTLSEKSLSSDLRYNALKAYLMLNDPSHFDKGYLLLYLKNSWVNTVPNDLQQSLLEQLSILFNQPMNNIALDPSLIEKNQTLLQKLSTQDLMDIIFDNQTLITQQKLSLNLSENKDAASVFTFMSQDVQLSNLYTQDSFDKLYPDAFKQLVSEAINGNWITGKIAREKAEDSDALVQSTQEDYLESYAEAWEDFLNNIKIINYTSLTPLNQSLSLLSSDQSPLIQLLQLAKTNLPLPVVKQDDNLQIVFSALNQPNATDQIKAALATLQQYVNPIVTDPNPDQQAFLLAKNRMQNQNQNDPIDNLLSLAKKYPNPIKSWLYGLATNTWELILDQTQQYINDQWQKNVITSYQSQIENRFPFNRFATNQVDLSSFEYFFAANGVFDQFFTNTLYPFLDTSTKYWQPKNINGYGLQLSDAVLEQLSNIHQIQITFFGNNQHLYIPFIIQPISIEDNITSISVSIGGQTMIYQNQTPFAQKTFIWPDSNNDQTATIIFNTRNNQKITFTSSGPWGWLKLLDQANLHSLDKSTIYQGTFDKNGYFAIIGIALKQIYNPFDLKLFNNLQLPNTLI